MTESATLSSQIRPSQDLADWHPLLVEAGIATPYTILVQTEADLSLLLDDQKPEGFDTLADYLHRAAARIGYPVFLRTGYGADSRAWGKTCFLRRPEDLIAHIYRLVRWSHATDQPLPTHTWAVREMLPLRPAFITHGGRPVARQRRYFFNGLGQVTGHQPLLTADDLLDGNPRGPQGPLTDDQWIPALDALNHESAEEIAHLTLLTSQVAQALLGDWAVDWIYVENRGWVAYDLTHFEGALLDLDHPTAPYTYTHPGSVPMFERTAAEVYDERLPLDAQDLYAAVDLIDDENRA